MIIMVVETEIQTRGEQGLATTISFISIVVPNVYQNLP